jgi:hypothetical protein
MQAGPFLRRPASAHLQSQERGHDHDTSTGDVELRCVKRFELVLELLGGPDGCKIIY